MRHRFHLSVQRVYDFNSRILFDLIASILRQKTNLVSIEKIRLNNFTRTCLLHSRSVNPISAELAPLDELMITMNPRPLAWVVDEALFHRVLGDILEDVL